MARNFKSFVESLVIVVVSLFVFSACTDEGADISAYKVKENIVKGTKYTDELTHNWDSTKTAARDRMIATTTIAAVENGEIVEGSERKEVRYPLMETEIFAEKNDYIITEDQVNCSVVASNILRNQDVKTVENNGKAVADTVVFNISDGQVVKCPSTITSYTTTDGHDMGSVELKDAKMVSIKNYTSGTRAASSYVKTVYNTVYTVKMTYTEKNVSRSAKEFVVYLTTNATRKLIASNDIESVKVENKNRVVIDDTTEKVSFEEVITMTNGETVRNSYSMILNREFKGIEAYDKFVGSFAFNLANVNGIANGAESQVKNAEGWTVYGKTDKYSANIANSYAVDAFQTSYTLYHERASFKNSNVEVAFGYENVTVSEAKNEVSTANSDKSGYDKAIFNNGIRTSYIGYVQNLSEYVNLYKTARAISGYDFRNATLVVNNNNVVASVEFVTIYNDGTETSEKVSKTFARSLKCTSNWTSYENEATQFTHMMNTVLTSSDAKRDGEWAWVNETRTITNLATLAASDQTNSWISVDPNSISFTREGQTYRFDAIEFKAIDKEGKVTLASQSEEMDVYAYSAELNVVFGNNTISSVAPGKIIVAKEIKGDFPAEWGKFVGAFCTLTCNENNTDWMYGWSLHFENGTLPVAVGKNAANAVIDQSLFAYDTNNSFNGAVYNSISGKWQNSIAQDKKHMLAWYDSNSGMVNALDRATAQMWGWNNSNITVFTSDFTFEVSNNGKSLVVKKNGKEFASYRASSK